MRKIISALLIIVCLFNAMSAFAYTASNVPKYLFDASYYSEKYEDLRNAFGTNKTKLYQHWCKYGMSEGRSPSPTYNPNHYLNNNPDLKQAFGTDYKALYNHFCQYGINEFRNSSEVYNGDYYKNAYVDLVKAFGNNSKKYIEHFVNYGMKEGRQASDQFNVNVYKSNYSDLQQAFGNNLKSYYYHYMNCGITEGRIANKSIVNNTNKVTSSTIAERQAWVKTSGSNLYLRKSATVSSSVVCKIPNNSQITLYGDSQNGFYKVKYSKYTGYASAEYISFDKPDGNTESHIGLVDSNLSKVKLIKQGSKTCKATAIAQSLNIITGTNTYTTAKLGNASCKNINGKSYVGSNGKTYKATYKTDSYKGSASEQMAQIDKAISLGLPIVVTVHKKAAGTKHHWVTIIGKNGNTYDIIDPATGGRRTMSSAGYAFGLADYSNGYHYGYVSFN